MDIVAFKLFGDYAHFSHPETIYSSLTYPVPPKTTIMGLLGAIIGEDDFWNLSGLRYAVKIDKPVEKKSFCFNGIKNALGKSIKLEEGYQDFSQRKQFYRELICNPSYIIYLDLSELSDEQREKAKNNLKDHKTVYTPYLGINLCLADFEWIEVKSCEKVEDEYAFVNTIVPIDQYQFDGEKITQKLSIFKMACDVEKGRYYKAFTDFLAELNGEGSIKALNKDNVYKVNDENVLFI